MREKWEAFRQKMAISREYPKPVREKLEAILREMAAYGEQANRGAGEQELARLTKSMEEAGQARLPREVLGLLKVINGIEYNGFLLYGIDEELLEKTPNQSVSGFLEMNRTWHENEWPKPYVFLGESSVSWYVYDAAEQKYEELDNPSGTVCEVFADFAAMLEKVLTDALL